jgi:hypothetical protein
LPKKYANKKSQIIPPNLPFKKGRDSKNTESPLSRGMPKAGGFKNKFYKKGEHKVHPYDSIFPSLRLKGRWSKTGWVKI